MLKLACVCGCVTDVPESFIGDAAECPACQKALRVVAGAGVTSANALSARLVVRIGPERVGEQLFLAGEQPIEVGKLADKPIALMAGTMVSRNHCRLVPAGGAWRVEDLKSTNGIYVNKDRVSRAVLKSGDALQVGDYLLAYQPLSAADAAGETHAALELVEEDLVEDGPEPFDLAAVEEKGTVLPDQPYLNLASGGGGVAGQAAGPGLDSGGPTCPCCERSLPRKAKVCVSCGIRVPSGRPIVIARGMDENDLAARADTWIKLISWIVWIGLFPVASEAFGTRKARVIWYVFGITVLTSVLFFFDIFSDKPEHEDLMLWTGSAEARVGMIDRYQGDDIDDLLDGREPEHVRRRAVVSEETLRRAVKRVLADPKNKNRKPEQLHAAVLKELSKPQPDEEFRGYQLITNALLHGGIMHLAGNMLFLLVFGLRVNELLGDLMFGIAYPLLAVLSGVIYMAAEASSPLHPALGASGAIMGLAGMYFVFFPVQHVHIAFWVSVRYFLFRRIFWYKLFRMRGFWLLVLWVGFNDVLPTVLAALRQRPGTGDGVAHWAHLGGFLSGMAIALGLLLARLATARGGDILSFTLGKAAWPLLGKPTRYLEAAIESTGPSMQRRVVLAGPR